MFIVIGSCVVVHQSCIIDEDGMRVDVQTVSNLRWYRQPEKPHMHVKWLSDSRVLWFAKNIKA